MINNLYLTLGHNASAILHIVEEDHIIGYEQERLDGIKSSSTFPVDAINNIAKHCGPNVLKNANVFISHWQNIANFKYPHILKAYANHFNWNIYSHTEQYTHHDAHRDSAINFAHEHKFENIEDAHILVADGFGNDQEVISLYKGSKLIYRVKGYNRSLGLMYQYATSFCGMKENQDEYKFLGYESRIDVVLTPNNLDILHAFVDTVFFEYLKKDLDIRNVISTVIDFDALEAVKENWHKIFKGLLTALDFDTKNGDITTKQRVIIGYAIQYAIQSYIINEIIAKQEISDIILVGGCFYNVKLNHAIVDHVPGQVCIMPLAGDQGTATGFTPFKYRDLCYGKRDVKQMPKYTDFYSLNQLIDITVSAIKEDTIVNIVQGNMEFGPRALCNTSTIASPTKQNVDLINSCNKRSTVMPMAPVMKRSDAKKYLDNSAIDRIVGSLNFMICAVGVYNKAIGDGVYHSHTRYESTARPQLVDDDHWIAKVIDQVEADALINTSFNIHGQPIVCDTSQIIRAQTFQQAQSKQAPKLIHVQ